jgi:hypothetical protein
LPELQRIATELRPRGVELVTVMLDGSPRAALGIARRTGLHAPVLIGTDELRTRMNVTAYPWTIVVDRDGRAVHALRGARSAGQFKELFEKYL